MADKCPDKNPPEIEIEIDKEIDINIEKEKERKKRKKNSHDSNESSSSSSSQIENVIHLYHETCKSLPKVRSVTDDRKRAIKKLLAQMSMDEIKEAFEKAENTPFLKGNNDRGWKANIDFMTKHSHLVKILEGVYDTQTKQPSYDISAYENMLGDPLSGRDIQPKNWWDETI